MQTWNYYFEKKFSKNNSFLKSARVDLKAFDEYRRSNIIRKVFNGSAESARAQWRGRRLAHLTTVSIWCLLCLLSCPACYCGGLGFLRGHRRRRPRVCPDKFQTFVKDSHPPFVAFIYLKKTSFSHTTICNFWFCFYINIRLNFTSFWIIYLLKVAHSAKANIIIIITIGSESWKWWEIFFASENSFSSKFYFPHHWAYIILRILLRERERARNFSIILLFLSLRIYRCAQT